MPRPVPSSKTHLGVQPPIHKASARETAVHIQKDTESVLFALRRHNRIFNAHNGQ